MFSNAKISIIKFYGTTMIKLIYDTKGKIYVIGNRVTNCRLLSRKLKLAPQNCLVNATAAYSPQRSAIKTGSRSIAKVKVAFLPNFYNFEKIPFISNKKRKKYITLINLVVSIYSYVW